MAWDERSNVGDVYLTPIMQYLGGRVRRGNDPHELGEYVGTGGTARPWKLWAPHSGAFCTASVVPIPLEQPENLKTTNQRWWATSVAYSHWLMLPFRRWEQRAGVGRKMSNYDRRMLSVTSRWRKLAVRTHGPYERYG